MKIYLSFVILIIVGVIGCTELKNPSVRGVAAVTSLTVPELFCTTIRSSPNYFQGQLSSTISANCDIAQPYSFNYIESTSTGVLCCNKK